MENINRHPGKNEDTNSRLPHSEDKKRTIDENGQRINWDNPEISEADNIEGRNPEISHQQKWPDQSDEKEIPDDPSVRKYYDQDPNVSTIHSSNADRTFGDEHKHEEQKGRENLNGDQSGYTSPSDDDDSNSGEEENSENENIEGDNES